MKQRNLYELNLNINTAGAKVMDPLVVQELKSLIENYNDLKYRRDKNLKGHIPTITEYISYVEKNCIMIFEKEYNVLLKQFSGYESANSIQQEFVEALVLGLKKLIPVYGDLIALVVDPHCEVFHNNLIKDSRETIDDIIRFGDLFSSSGELVSNSDNLFGVIKDKLRFHGFVFSALKSSLNQLRMRNESSNKESTLIKVKNYSQKYFYKFFLVLVLGFAALYLFSPEVFTQNYINALKLTGWIILLLWIPFWFPRTMPNKNKQIIPLILLAALCILLTYGLIWGFWLLILLLGYPLKEIHSFSSNASSTKKANRDAKKVLILPMMVSLAIVFIITLEPLWYIGFVVWVIWAYTCNISLKYFRPAFDTISKHDQGKKELIKDPWIFASLFFSCIFIILEGLSITTNEFLRDLYLTSAQIALTLVGFLLALQAILGNISLKSDTEKQRIFELEMIFRSMEGLKGFMITFMSLFIISVLGAFSTKSTNDAELRLTIAWILNPIDLNIDDLAIFYKITLFVCFITLLSLNVAYLNYLFHSSSLLILPFKSVLSSKPILIEKFSNWTSSKLLEEDIKQVFTKESDLNGLVLHEMLINDLEHGLFANCEFEVSFPNKQELMNRSVLLGNILIEKRGFTKVTIWARSNEGSLGLIKIFQVDLNKEKMDFLNQANNLDLEYKFNQIGAFFSRSAYTEDQLM
ncbi:MAG: hypothetical protein WA137_01655 [Methanothrix sp.]